MNILRRLPLPRLLLVCGAVLALGISLTALASALSSGPTPPAKPLAQAIHDALAGPPVQGLSANVTLTDHLLEGASLVGGADEGAGGGGGGAGEITSNPLVKGASGRMWVSSDGRVRLELQSEKGDTQVTYDGHQVSIYDAATNTLYRYTPKEASASDTGTQAEHGHEAPSVAKVEEALDHLREHVNVSDAQPVDVAGQAAYTVRISPKEGGSLIGGAELSFDAYHGIPLRAAVYSTTSTAPVLELAATEASYGPVDPSVFSITPPADAKIEEIATEGKAGTSSPTTTDGSRPQFTTKGHGIAAVGVLQSKSGSASSTAGSLSNLPKVDVNGTSASELRTELGTLLTFERAGVRYVVAGAVSPAAVESVARGL